AANGDANAQAILGRRLLTQIPADWDQGIALTAAASKAGIGEATHFLAVIAAMGRIAPPDWESAFVHLQRAAEQGYKPAQAQLALLAPQTEAAKRFRKGKAPERDD